MERVQRNKLNAKNDYQKYKGNFTRVTASFHNIYDRELINFINENVDNKQNYIRQLIIQDMNKIKGGFIYDKRTNSKKKAK